MYSIFSGLVLYMYSGEYVCDVTLSVNPHRASLKNMPGHVGIEPTELVRCGYTLRVTSQTCIVLLTSLSYGYWGGQRNGSTLIALPAQEKSQFVNDFLL